MLSSLLLTLSTFAASAVAQSSTVVCVAGQCLQGFSNTTIGAKLSADDAPTDILLLPGSYSESTNPQLLHDILTSSSAQLSPSAGFENSSSSFSLPLNLGLQTGLAIYSESFYAGSSGFTPLPSSPLSNSSTPLSAKSLALSTNIWVAVGTGSGSDERVVLWDAVPDVSQLPTTGTLTLLDIQSSACSPSCAGAGICTASGTCSCPTGFTGSSCESCASGFFGPECQPCPSGCDRCDEGLTGTGRCLTLTIENAPATCNCANGQCGSNGQCSCNDGWTTADDGTACGKCADGFFLTSTGDCQVCQLGCSRCANTSGTCLTCKTGFTQDQNDKTRCNAAQSVTSSGTVCPDGSFSNGAQCAPCSASCETCTGATSNDCVRCASGQYAFNGGCVSANTNGVCEGTSLIADNNKRACDTCGAKCTSCEIPNFSVASTVNQLQCTGCLPGSFLSGGKCIDSCPTGTFVSPEDNMTCAACDPSCGTCAGSGSFCLTCPNNQLASNGQCVSECPSGTFSSSGSCLTCHPDCASCSGSSFNQCSSCPADRPVLTNGRCLPTCSKSQYFDKTSGQCQSCDSTCSSCSGPGGSACLACSSSSQVLRSGACVDAGCQGSSSVIAGLGVCLSELVVVPPQEPSGTVTPAPLPSITGLSDPTVVNNNSSTNRLEWWQILLMALGCAFIFVVVLWWWRRRARKQRAKRTAAFATAKRIGPMSNWRWRLLRFGEKLFGHRASKRRDVGGESEEMKLMKLRNAEEARHNNDIEKIIKSYQYERPEDRERDLRRAPSSSTMSGPSMYSQVTGMPRKGPDTKQPVRKGTTPARFSSGTTQTYSTYHSSGRGRDLLAAPTRAATDAEAYAEAHRPRLEPTFTGSSKNPFRR